MSQMPSSRNSTAGFTLVELLAVMLVLVLLLALAAPALLGSMSASRLATAGDLLLNKLSEAQQLAIASDSEVEVRFYEQPDAQGADATPRLRSFQLLTLATGGDSKVQARFQPASPVTRFGEGIVGSSKNKITSLMDLGFKTDATVASSPGRHLSVRFLSDGSTDLAPGSRWFLTLVDAGTEARDGVPPNYYTIQIDAITGRVRSFRP